MLKPYLKFQIKNEFTYLKPNISTYIPERILLYIYFEDKKLNENKTKRGLIIC